MGSKSRCHPTRVTPNDRPIPVGRGFTLIELIFVMVILGWLLVAAMPRLRQGWTALEMERTAFELAQMLRTARVLAITTNQPITWTWNADTRRAVLQQATDPPTPLTGRLGRPRAVPQEVALSVLQSEQPVERITFLPDGTSQSTMLLIGDAFAPRSRVTVDGSTSQVAVR